MMIESRKSKKSKDASRGLQRDNVRSRSFWAAVTAELIGAFAFSFLTLSGGFLGKNALSVSAIVAGATPSTAANTSRKDVGDEADIFAVDADDSPDIDNATLLGLSLLVSACVACVTTVFAGISGGHANPTITVAFWVSGRMSVCRASLYVAMQYLGATIGAAMMRVVHEDIDAAMVDTPIQTIWINASLRTSVLYVLTMETVMSALLVIVVMSVCDLRRRDVAGSNSLHLAVAHFVINLTCLGKTGAWVNPARQFGAAAMLIGFRRHWAFEIAPYFGSMFCAMFYRFFLAPTQVADAHWRRSTWLIAKYRSLDPECMTRKGRPSSEDDVDDRVNKLPSSESSEDDVDNASRWTSRPSRWTPMKSTNLYGSTYSLPSHPRHLINANENNNRPHRHQFGVVSVPNRGVTQFLPNSASTQTDFENGDNWGHATSSKHSGVRIIEAPSDNYTSPHHWNHQQQHRPRVNFEEPRHQTSPQRRVAPRKDDLDMITSV